MGKSDTSAPKHSQQSIVIVPPNTPGVKLIRPMQVFGYDEFSPSSQQIGSPSKRLIF
jgi:hypothetical protein